MPFHHHFLKKGNDHVFNNKKIFLINLSKACKPMTAWKKAILELLADILENKKHWKRLKNVTIAIF